MTEPVAQKTVDPTSFFLKKGNLLIIGNIQKLDVIVIDKGIIQLIIFIVEFDNRRLKVDALFQNETLGERARRIVPQDHFQRNDFDLFIELFCLRQLLKKVGRHTSRI